MKRRIKRVEAPWRNLSVKKSYLRNPDSPINYRLNGDVVIEKILKEDALVARRNPEKWGPSLYNPFERNHNFREPPSDFFENS